MDKATYKYYIDWNNDGDFNDPYEDISAYVLTSAWEMGSDSAEPNQVKAGVIRLKLDNSSAIFSPNKLDNPFVPLPGLRVKITMKIGGGAEVTMAGGYLESIDPIV